MRGSTAKGSLSPPAIVYLLAGCEARRTELRGPVRDSLRRTDFAVLADLLRARRLLPLIGLRAIEAAPDIVPDAFQRAVATAWAHAAARGIAHREATAELVDALAAEGIRAMPLKGALLAADAHGDLGLRATSDIDLLVPTPRLDEAVEVMRRRGFSAPADPRRPNGLPDLHFGLRHATLPPVELHWRIHWHETAFSEGLLDRAAPAADGLLRPEPADLIALLLLFHARDGLLGVRPPTDLASWWDRNPGVLPPRCLEPCAARHPGLAPALTAAAVTMERLTGVPVAGWLGDRVAHSRRVSLAIRLADWAAAADPDQLSANITLVAALLGPRGSEQDFARRELLLEGHGRTDTAVHTTKTAARAAYALWAIRGGRSWAKPPPEARRASAAPVVQHREGVDDAYVPGGEQHV